MYYLVKSLGYKYISIRLKEDKPDIYSIRITTNKYRKNPIAVKKIVELPEVTQDTFVYDIETTKGSFLGGVGSINPSNTDSIYSAMPEKHFQEIDRIYYTGGMAKVDYWSEQVNITFREIAIINKEVNEMLIEDNGTKFLKMAFEESIYPVAFLAKKEVLWNSTHISAELSTEGSIHPRSGSQEAWCVRFLTQGVYEYHVGLSESSKFIYSHGTRTTEDRLYLRNRLGFHGFHHDRCIQAK
jgi:hypothetical protein